MVVWNEDSIDRDGSTQGSPCGAYSVPPYSVKYVHQSSRGAYGK